MTATTFLDKPTLGPMKLDPYPYQAQAVDAIRAEFQAGRKSTLLVLPTGTGKTITFGMVARKTIEKGNRCLILAHRGELIDQAVAKLDLLGVEACIEKAESQARSIWQPDAVVASVQTMRGDRLRSWPSDYFQMIVTDEAHHATAESYQRIYKHFPKARHLGVTATPDRADEQSLGLVFESIAYEMTLAEAITAPSPGPYLCAPTVAICDVDIDLSQIRITAGDFNEKDLAERITPMVEKLANAIRQEIGDRRTIVFTPDVGSAQAMATALRSIGLKADWISGDDLDRKYKIARIENGDLQILCNCALLTEGFDCPAVSAVVLCRPTKSRALYAQMVGRGTRLCPAIGKKDCLIVDFNYLTTTHDLVKPASLFASSHTAIETLGLADALLREKKSKGMDLLSIMRQAEEEHHRRTVVKVKARERKIEYRRRTFNPLGCAKTFELDWKGPTQATINLATEGQVRYLRTFGVEDAGTISKTQAGTLISFLKRRREAGLATYKQVSRLIASGMDATVARSLSLEQASEHLDRLFGGKRQTGT